MNKNETKKGSANSFLMGGGFMVIGILLGVFVFSYFFPIGPSWLPARAMNIDEQREQLIAYKASIQEELIGDGQYACCLEKPCTYCIEKTPGHGEGATCNCLEDVVNGRHPCGECMGEILEGHGITYLSEYFAESIAEEVGEEHLEEIQEIIDEKYSATSNEEDCDEQATVCEIDLDNLDQGGE